MQSLNELNQNFIVTRLKAVEEEILSKFADAEEVDSYTCQNKKCASWINIAGCKTLRYYGWVAKAYTDAEYDICTAIFCSEPCAEKFFDCLLKTPVKNTPFLRWLQS